MPSDAGSHGRDVWLRGLPELAGCPVGDRIAARLGLPTIVDNDVNALTLGEVRFGAARGLRSVVLLALGTGVGGGVYLDGALVRGAAGYAGELGHAPIAFDGRACFCGGRGCLIRGPAALFWHETAAGRR